MDDILLADAVERYSRGEMSDQEKTYFEGLRKNNAELDQLVVEHTFFLNEMSTHADTRNFKHSLQEVEQKLIKEGVISKTQLKGKAKVVFLWKKYRRNVAVAASIAVLVSLATTGLIVSYNNQNKQSALDQLSRKVYDLDKKFEMVEFAKAATSSKLPVHPENPKFAGTGFIIDSKGYLLTNVHVINKMKTIYVENSKGEYFNAVPFYTDAESDLAILKITDSATFKLPGAIPYSIRKNNSDLGEQIFTLGYPRNDIVYGEGYLSATSGNDGDSTAYQLFVPANPGNSGGPVINKNGEVIGIITSKNSSADGVVFAAKSKNLYRMLDEIKKDDNTPNIKLPVNSTLKGMDRQQQVKKVEDFVFMVVGDGK